MKDIDVIKYWFNEAQKELGCFKDDTAIEYVKGFCDAGIIHHKELENRAGVVAYIISKDFRGENALTEVFMYIKPEYRGNPRNILKIVKIMEDDATKYGCDYVAIGSNIGYRDDKLLALLEKKGYTKDTVRKYINERT